MQKGTQKQQNNSRRGGNNTKSPVRIEHSAGGVVFKHTRRGVLIGLIMDSYRKWTFPKGHVEKNESPSDAALRETREEMGLVKLRLVRPLGTTLIKFKDRFDQPGTMVHKNIDYFLMETSLEETGKAENKSRGERIHAIRWVPPNRVSKIVSYKNMLPIIKKVLAHLSGRVYPLSRPVRRR